MKTKKRVKKRKQVKFVVPTFYFRDGGPSMREPEIVSLDQRCGGGRRILRKEGSD